MPASTLCARDTGGLMAVRETTSDSVPRISLLRVFRENRVYQGLLLISPADLYLFVFMILPLILVVILSFLSRGHLRGSRIPFQCIQLLPPVRSHLRKDPGVLPGGRFGNDGDHDSHWLSAGILHCAVSGATAIPAAFPDPRALLDQFCHPHLCLDHDPAGRRLPGFCPAVGAHHHRSRSACCTHRQPS